MQATQMPQGHGQEGAGNPKHHKAMMRPGESEQATQKPRSHGQESAARPKPTSHGQESVQENQTSQNYGRPQR